MAATTNLIPKAGAASGAVTNELRDIRPPWEIPTGWALVGWVPGILAIMVAAFFAWRYWRKRQEKLAVIPVIPPHVRAKQRLKEALDLIGQPREFCTAVSDTIRSYLEERFNFHAPERTTEEFLYELRETNLLTPEQKDGLGEFLKRCDLVKFARYEPHEPELRDLHESALRLVDETEPVAEPAAVNAVHASTGHRSSPPSIPHSEHK